MVNKQTVFSPIDTVHQWILSESGKKPRDSSFKFQHMLARKTVKRIEELLVSKARLVTFRGLNDESSAFLRPIFSFPTELSLYFKDPELQLPFKYSSPPFDEPNIFKFDGFGGNGIGGAVFEIDDEMNWQGSAENESTSTKLDEFPFSKRIKRLLGSLKQGKWHQQDGFCSTERKKNALNRAAAKLSKISKQLKSDSSVCLVLGRYKKNKFSHFIALYLQSNNNNSKEIIANLDKNGHEISKLIGELFQAIDIIKSNDIKAFRGDSLRLVSDLIPVFQNKLITPAKKMSFLLTGLQNLLEQHLVGIDYSESSLENGVPLVYFISTTYTRPMNDSDGYFPNFNIYPPFFENQSPLGTCLISHRDSPTITKMLLKDYFDNSTVFADQGSVETSSDKVRLPLSFSKLFHGKRHDYKKNTSGKLRDRIYLTSHKHPKSWMALNRNVRIDEEPAQSLVAYVIEGAETAPNSAKNERFLPKGILAFESSVVDGFSPSDIEVLAEIAERTAPLIRSISNDSSSIDYENVLASTFLADIETSLGGSDQPTLTLGHFLFQLVRIDAKSYNDIIKHLISENYPQVAKIIGIEKENLIKIQETHQNILISQEDPNVSKDKSEDEILIKRRTMFLSSSSQLKELYKEIGPDIVYKFFEACPSNFVWSSYMRSVANALADRRLVENPILTRIGAGFSAFDVYAATVSGELRQVIKLSRGSDLIKERENYRNFVRYKLPLAARIPHEGFAFDSNGDIDSSGYSGKSLVDRDHQSSTFGALVSDLIDGAGGKDDELAKSYLEYLLTIFRDRPSIATDSSEELAAIDEIVKPIRTALKFNFGSNYANWRNLNSVSQKKSRNIIKPNTRLPNVIKGINGFRISPTDDPSKLRKVFRKTSKLDRTSAIVRILEGMYHWQQNALNQYVAETDAFNFSSLKDVTDKIDGKLLSTKHSIGVLTDRRRCIAHRDLNARNLAWAHHIGRLVPIDFEHVGYSVWGIDQAKLVMSTVTELHSEFLIRHQELGLDVKHEAALLNALDYLILNKSKIYQNFYGQSLVQYENIESINDDFNSYSATTQIQGKHLATIITDILLSMEHSDTQYTEKSHYSTFLLRCAAVKEFYYALSEVDDSFLRFLAELVTALETDRLKNGDYAPSVLVEKMRSLSEELPRTEQKSILRRTSKLAYSFCALVTTLEKDTMRKVKN